MRTFPHKIAVAAVITAVTLPAPAAHAIVDPRTLQGVQSITRVDPITMANCATGSVANPAGAVVIPPEVPLVGCLTV